MPRVLLDLSTDELGYVIRQLPNAIEIAHAAEVCRSFKTAVKHAADARAAAPWSSVPVPPLKPGEPKLRAVWWAEDVGGRARTMSAGDSHALCVSKTGTLCTWGSNYHGQRGSRRAAAELGTPSHVAAGAMHSVMVDRSGAVWTWGHNRFGRLGHGDEADRDGPERIASLAGTRILQAATGDDYTLLLTDAGGVLAFGHHTAQLGLGATVLGATGAVRTPTAVPGFAGRRVVEVSAGAAHSLAVDDAGGLWAWGEGFFLCHDDGFDRDEPTQVAALAANRVRHATAGSEHTLVVTAAGELYACGDNNFGQLGLGHNESQRLPQLVTALAGKPVLQVDAGGHHSVVLTEAGEVYAMGKNENGELGVGDTEERVVPTRVVSLGPPLSEAQLSAIDELEVHHRRLEQLGLGVPEAAQHAAQLRSRRGNTSVVEVTAGYDFTFAVTSNGDVYSWGYGVDGCLGTYQTETDRPTPGIIEHLEDVHALK
jgi:alpha-tubulin suppressor-like RCC1 family protein